MATQLARTGPHAIRPEAGGASAATVAWGPNFGGADGDQHEVGVEITLAQVVTSGIVAPKDVYTPTVALCPDDANKNGENLLVSGTVGASADAYMAWDMASFPSTAVISSATLTLNVTAAPAASQSINIFKIANADEGWDEAAMVCSTREPADGAAVQTFSSGTATGDISIPLNATVVARLQARMGVGFATLLLQNVALNVLSTTFQRGDGNALGPRLTLTMTLAL